MVFGDVDLDATVPQVVRAAFTNNGQVRGLGLGSGCGWPERSPPSARSPPQVCLCGSRVFVHESVYAAFVPR